MNPGGIYLAVMSERKWVPHPKASPQGRAWGRTLWERRHAMGLTQTQVGRLVGTTQVNIARWERGIRVPRPEWQRSLIRELRFTDADRDRLAERLLPVAEAA